MEQPSLIEASTKNYLFNTLKQCHNNRVNLYYYVFNAIVFLIFIAIVGTILYRCSMNKPTEYERQQKILRDQQYVMSKIRYYKDEVEDNDNQHNTRLTNLPFAQG
jgi:uncharacterized protein YcfL